MGGSVSILAVQTALFACLALACAAVYFGLRRDSAIGWLTAALTFGFVQMLLFRAWPSDQVEIAAGFLLGPAGFYCNAQCLRRAFDRPGHSTRWWSAVAVMVAAGLLMVAAGIPYLPVMALYQLTVLAAVSDCLRIARPSGRKSWFDWPLLLAYSALATIFIVRLPAWLLLLPAGFEYAQARQSPVDAIILSVGAFATCIITGLLVGRIVSKQIAQLRSRSSRDGLTGLLNRKSFVETASRPVRRPGAIVYCDIDHFKQVNDRFGHGVGDRVIRELARLLDNSGYVAGRLGGEEFALFMPSVPALRAHQLIEDLREAFSDLDIDGVDPRHRLTASFGIATFDGGHRPSEYLDQADRALYLAKNNGRDQVIMLRSDHGPAPARVKLSAAG